MGQTYSSPSSWRFFLKVPKPPNDRRLGWRRKKEICWQRSYRSSQDTIIVIKVIRMCQLRDPRCVQCLKCPAGGQQSHSVWNWSWYHHSDGGRFVGYLDLGSGCEDAVVWVFQTLLFEPLRLGADEQVEMCCQVASQQGFIGRNVEQEGERFHVEARLQNLQSTKTWEESTTRESEQFL